MRKRPAFKLHEGPWTQAAGPWRRGITARSFWDGESKRLSNFSWMAAAKRLYGRAI